MARPPQDDPLKTSGNPRPRDGTTENDPGETHSWSTPIVDEQADDSPPLEHGQRSIVSNIILVIALIAGALMLGILREALQVDAPVLFIGTFTAFLFAAFLLLAAFAFRRGKQPQGAIHLTIALIAAVATYLNVSPGGTAFIALMPIVIIAAVLPFVRKKTLITIFVLSWTLGAAFVAANILWIPAVTVHPLFDLAFRITMYIALLGLSFTLLYAHHERFSASLQRARKDARSLRKARDELEQADRAKTRFLNSAAHELRTPLTPLMMQLELMRRNEATSHNERLQRSLDLADRNVRRLKTHVDDLLDIARMQYGKRTIQTKPVPLADILWETEMTYRNVIEEKGLKLQVDPADGAWVQADSTRIIQVLYNLVDNAVKATPPGGALHIKHHIDTEKQNCTVQVTDTGKGVPIEDQARLFEPFEQTERTEEGAGLGLYISRLIMEAHHGTIHCISTGTGTDTGATFEFTLPLASPPSARQQDLRQLPHPSSGSKRLKADTKRAPWHPRAAQPGTQTP